MIHIDAVNYAITCFFVALNGGVAGFFIGRTHPAKPDDKPPSQSEGTVLPP